MREVTGRSAVDCPESRVTDLSGKERNLEAGLKKGAVEFGKMLLGLLHTVCVRLRSINFKDLP